MRRILLLLALCGCAAVQPLVNPVDAILAEAVAAARAQQAGVATPSDRLRLATLLATLPPPLRDDARAVELLEPIADAKAPGIGRFAALLASQVVDRQRNARELERVSKEAERAARERANADRERDRLEKEREKEMQALRQQLEALRAIERGILEREEKLRKRQK